MIPEHKNYSLLIEAEESYPVLYTVSQNGTKVFRPQYISGKDLTEPQIKYLDQIGYFGDTPTQPVVNEDEVWNNVFEEARQYAESKMHPSGYWDRKDEIQIGAFFQYYFDYIKCYFTITIK